jgi:putative methionine-R-sulfoxide reductase with GAF domain
VRRHTLAGVPEAESEAPPRYTPEQEAALKRLAQILAGVIRRQVDAQLPASRRVK